MSGMLKASASPRPSISLEVVTLVFSSGLVANEKGSGACFARMRRTPLSPWSWFAAQSLGSANTVSVPPSAV